MAKELKTNVMRILEKEHIAFQAYTYPQGAEAVDGETVAKLIGKDPAQVLKTLVVQGKSKAHYVCCIPVQKELDLKKTAEATGEKSIQMVHVKDLFMLTGYVRGGCSPIGLKKPFPIYIDSHAETLEHIVVSAGKIGYQVELSPKDLQTLTQAKFADITVEGGV